MIGWSALQYEALVAIAAVDIALFINFKPDAGMAQRSAARNIGCAIAGHAMCCHTNGFWGFDHDLADSNAQRSVQRAKTASRRNETRLSCPAQSG